MIQQLIHLFAEKFKGTPRLFRSPGRINFLGEHTDYNEGFVLPAAIDKAVYIAITKRNDDTINLFAKQFDQSHSISISSLSRSSLQWPNYILGVVDQFKQKGLTMGGFDLVIDGDVPDGAGLSSSAAVECVTAFALNQLFDLKLDKMQLVKSAQKAEHEYAGVKVGIMDQFASMFGKSGHVVQLDCRSLNYEYVPLDLLQYEILLLNTNVKHSLASTEYNTRRSECERGVAILQQHFPRVHSLRDATMEMLEKAVLPQDKLIYKRCKYVVEENRRVLEANDDLRHGRLTSLGKKMYATHHGLSKEYEVSCAESDFLVEYVKDNADVLGARMMGGGFGGCTINIVQKDKIEALITNASQAYQQKFGYALTPYRVKIENGTEEIFADDLLK